MINHIPINCQGNISGAVTAHYYKDGWQNLVPNTTSLIKANGVLVEYD